MNARRASTTEAAREYRQRGHDDALLFALAIGLDNEYRRDQAAKKDVIDPAGDAHSVKSGRKKWQIFLYSRNRFVEDDGFQALNGIGSLLVHCIDAFPPRYSDYADNKDQAEAAAPNADAGAERPLPAQGCSAPSCASPSSTAARSTIRPSCATACSASIGATMSSGRWRPPLRS